MTDEQADRLEQKLDQLLELAPTIDAIGRVLVRRQDVTERLGLNKNTLAQNDQVMKFDDGKQTYIRIGDVKALRRRKSPRKQHPSRVE